MNAFENFNLTTPLYNAVTEMGFSHATPIQVETYSLIRSGRDVVGIAQTGTGKTLAYLLPLLREIKFSKELNPRILIVVPTRELVIQIADYIKELTKYMNVRTLGIYGGVNINTQKKAAIQGMDILVATPGRLFDLAVTRIIQLKSVSKLIIDEVDVMLDLGFRPQIQQIFEMLPERRQNIMFSATMTDEVHELIDTIFVTPARVSIAVSGTPLENIEQSCFEVPNFYTKANFLRFLLLHKHIFKKVLVFVGNKASADRLFETFEETSLAHEICVIHANKSQNYRIRSLEDFERGRFRVLIATDVMARGLDLDRISHVINFDTPHFPENYMHRIGRTGRATEHGKAILFFTEKEKPWKEAIEALMQMEIPEFELPEEVEVESRLTPEERPETGETK
ncbi:MAG TPA: DEAD/DEAH box helicase, partial [Bacteroidales bacterium]|nr:DEAD/DEAH box helicase [Bacteroidales bacterium]